MSASRCVLVKWSATWVRTDPVKARRRRCSPASSRRRQALVLPTLGGLFVWHAAVLGTRLAALHLGVGLVVSAVLMEALFVRYPLVPFVSGDVPSGELRSRGVASAAALLLLSFAIAWAERLSFSTLSGYGALLTVLAGLTLIVAVVDRTSGVRMLDLEQPLLATRLLNLAE